MTSAKNERLKELTLAICADPNDTNAILVFADHLEERGDRRAPYLRKQLALRELGPDKDRRPLLGELRALYPAETPAWLGRLEQAGVVESNLTGLPAAWWGQNLPNRPGEGTYTQYSAKDLPGLPFDDFDGTYRWLREAPESRGSPADICDPAPWAELLSALEERGFAVPPALRALMTSEALQGAIPSSTANYFISAAPDRQEIDPDALQDLEEGVAFLPFYSDQQCCVRWGVWLERDGGRYAPVISAGLDWGDEEEDEQAVEEDSGPTYCGFEFAAPTVESFIYRTWIENRIWFATVYNQTKRDLYDFEVAYVRHYQPQQS
jgi:uncharacterized protein (TIGR02996 family)